MASSWDTLFVSTPWINNSFPGDLYKRWLLAAGPAFPLTVSWVNPPDSHCSITAHPSVRGHGRQLSHSLQIKSMSDPSWASCLQGSFESTRATLCGIHKLLMSQSVCVWVSAYREIELKGPLSPSGAFHLVLYVFWQNYKTLTYIYKQMLRQNTLEISLLWISWDPLGEMHVERDMIWVAKRSNVSALEMILQFL